LNSKMVLGIDDPQHFLTKIGFTFEAFYNFQYPDLEKYCGCENYLKNTKTNSIFACGTIVK